MTEVSAQLNRIRLAPRKVRAVANLLKGKSADNALRQLEYLIKKPALPLAKLIKSAIANAENNFNMVRENLYIKSFIVNEGVKLKRFKPKGFGRAAMIQKKTSLVTLVLDEKTPGLKRDKKVFQEDKKILTKEEEVPKGVGEKKPAIKRKIGQRSLIPGLGGLKKLFNRKTTGGL